MKVTNLEQTPERMEQQLGKMNSLLENFIIAQQTQGRFPTQLQQNPKPANYVEETHEQVHAITTLRSGKQIDKTIAPKEIKPGEDESRGLGREIGSKKSESKKDKGKDKDHESNYEPSNEVALEYLKHTLFPHR